MALLSELGWFRQRREEWEKGVAEDSRRRFLPFDRVALCVYRWGLLAAPSWLLIDAAKRFRTAGEAPTDRERIEEEKENATALYATVWFVLLVAIWLLSPSSDFFAKAVACIAIFRLTEIGNTIIGFVLNRREPLLGRSLLTVAFQATQIALIFAIADHAFARHDFVTKEGTGASHAATTAFDYLYLSLTSMITVGNHYTPETGEARWLEVSTAAAGIILLSVVVARAIGLAGDEKDQA